MKDDITTELVEKLMSDFHYNMPDALDVLYTSETFDRLQDNETGLYYQSPGYVYSFLQGEVREGRIK
jgi:hypothetical protein